MCISADNLHLKGNYCIQNEAKPMTNYSLLISDKSKHCLLNQ